MRLRHGLPDERNAHENRIPIHYSKRDTFWVGQEGCGYSLGTGGMKGNGTNIPLLFRIPNGIVSSDMPFG